MALGVILTFVSGYVRSIFFFYAAATVGVVAFTHTYSVFFRMLFCFVLFCAVYLWGKGIGGRVKVRQTVNNEKIRITSLFVVK